MSAEVRLDQIFKVDISTWIDKNQDAKIIEKFKEILKENEEKFEKVGNILDNCEFDDTKTSSRQEEIDELRSQGEYFFMQLSYNDKLIKRMVYRIRSRWTHWRKLYRSLSII